MFSLKSSRTVTLTVPQTPVKTKVTSQSKSTKALKVLVITTKTLIANRVRPTRRDRERVKTHRVTISNLRTRTKKATLAQWFKTMELVSRMDSNLISEDLA